MAKSLMGATLLTGPKSLMGATLFKVSEKPQTSRGRLFLACQIIPCRKGMALVLPHEGGTEIHRDSPGASPWKTTRVREGPLTKLVQGSWAPSLEAVCNAEGWPWLKQVVLLLRWRNVACQTQPLLVAHWLRLKLVNLSPLLKTLNCMLGTIGIIRDLEAVGSWVLEKRSGGFPRGKG